MIAVAWDDGQVVQAFDCNTDTWCQGMRTGETGAMCGGCDGCCIAQAEYAGYDLEYMDVDFAYLERLERIRVKVDWKEEGF